MSTSEAEPATAPAEGLGGAAVSGARWTALSRLVVEGSSFVAVIVASRILGPSGVGVAAVPLIFTILAQGLSQQGFGSAIVQAERVTTHQVGVAHLISVMAGFGLTLVTLGIGVLCAALGNDELGRLIGASGIAFVVVSPGSVPMALIQRRLDFRRIAAVDSVAGVVGAGTIVVCAVAGAGPVSLVAGPIALGAVASVGYTLGGGVIHPAWSRSEARALFGFGAPAAGSNLAFVGARNVDYAILTTTVSNASVGLYVRAFQLAIDYQTKISGILVRMALPLFSRAQAADVRRIRARMTRVHAAAVFPLLVTLMALADLIVPVLFGPEWDGAADLTRILAVGGLATVLNTGSGPLLVASGHPRHILLYNAALAAAVAVAAFSLSSMGLVAVAAGVATVEVVGLIGLQRGMVQPLVGIPALDTLVRDPAPALVSCLPLAGVDVALAALLDGHVGPDVVTLAIAAACGLAAYALTLRFLFPSAWKDLRTLMPGGRR